MHLNRNALLSRAGPIPSRIGNCNGVLAIFGFIRKCSDNQFSGSVTGSVTQLKNCYEFFVASNNAKIYWGQYSSQHRQYEHLEARGLDLRNNRVTGPIPASVAQCPHLRGLFLSNNGLTGAIPKVVAYEVYLDDNRLSGGLLLG
jgi:hypothetical protein